jgi:t-SNARE complex subunit (syntaxin)
MTESPLDENHGLLKAKFLASARRLSRKANGYSNQTKTLEAALDEEEEKGEDSKLFKLTQRLQSKVNGAKGEKENA